MAIKPIHNTPATEKQILKSRFWAKFNAYSKEIEEFCKEFTPHPYADVRGYQDYAVGCGAYHIAISVDFQHDKCSVGVYFRDVDAWDVYYKNYKDSIEENIGAELEWKRHTTKGSSFLYESYDLSDEDFWKDAFNFLVRASIVMKREFAKYHSSIKKYWLVSWNEKEFRLHDYFREFQDTIDWNNPSNRQFNVGDIVYLYSSSPEQTIRYKAQVIKTEVPKEEEIDDSLYKKKRSDSESKHVFRLKKISIISDPKLDYERLKKHGLNCSIRTPINAKGELLEYIKSVLEKEYSDNDFEELQETEGLFEGAKKTVVVNQYERNPKARRECIAANGYKCKVCGMDFEKIYGEIGKDFIHVHHVVPISSIGKEYKLNPVNELVPVCPNCHAMLHRGKDGIVLTVEELKKIISKK